MGLFKTDEDDFALLEFEQPALESLQSNIVAVCTVSDKVVAATDSGSILIWALADRSLRSFFQVSLPIVAEESSWSVDSVEALGSVVHVTSLLAINEAVVCGLG